MLPMDEAHYAHPLLENAVVLHRQERFDEAAAIYRQILAEVPGYFDATHLLGVLALQQGQFETAQRLINSALEAKPGDVTALGNLGISYMRGGQFELAHGCFEKSLAMQPNSLSSLTNLGTVLHHLGRTREAVTPLRRAYSQDPNSHQIRNLLGACLIKNGETGEAAQFFKLATEAEPDDAETWANLSVAFNALEQHAEARDAAMRAVSLKPDSPKALQALGAAQNDMGNLTQAIDSYRQAAARPDASVELLLAFANVLLRDGCNDEAIIQLRRAIPLDDRNLDLRWALTMAHLKPVYRNAGEITESRRSFASAVEEIASWYATTPGIEDAFNTVGVSQPFYLAYQPFNNRELLQRYGTLCTAWMATLPDCVPSRRSTPAATGRKIRVGFASAHIHEHSVWNAITKGWVCHLDTQRFDVTLFQLTTVSDKETEAARQTVSDFVDQPTSLAAWAKDILDRDLDVLIYPEIGMDPLTVRLAALRLAPVQAASWGHPETTGLPTIDLYLSAEAFEPDDAIDNYSEKLIQLPKLGVHVTPLKTSMSKPGLRSLNLPAGEPLLLCAGSPFKYSPLYDDVWVDIARSLKKKFLKRSTGGRLVFFRSRSDSIDQMFESRLRAAFARQSVDFDATVSIVPNLERSRFFGLMHESALMLDTPGFSGFNTALQAIECGLPVLAFEGEFMRGRLASGIMRLLELPELVATTPADFVQRAIELAIDAPKRKKLRALITERRKILFGDLTPIRALEDQLTNAVNQARHAPL